MKRMLLVKVQERLPPHIYYIHSRIAHEQAG